MANEVLGQPLLHCQSRRPPQDVHCLLMLILCVRTPNELRPSVIVSHASAGSQAGCGVSCDARETSSCKRLWVLGGAF